ncbi:uncharacterized protein [Halyomorpha halys]|uniref:uncharacterized protein isoform X2 n=1 Tax=Halyomorpha halys TaxID=286706 RepID=UPI0006D52296|nr:sperm-tail PG-rich repeat-containing protein 2-like isoform X2 [Halyomorpha halys]
MLLIYTCCHVPFNCSTNALALADTGVPAPCTYNIRYRKHRIKGGASLRFTDPRVTFSRKPGPSPLSYDPDLLYAQKCEKQTKGKIFRGKPSRSEFVPSVSIPPKLFDGFDIIKGKGLILRPPRLEFRKRIEPMLRHFPYELSETTLRYKGNQWSKLRAERKFILSGNPDTPGVGQYNLLDKPPNPMELYLIKLRTYNSCLSDILKSNDSTIKNMIGPGPCTYEIDYEPIFKQCSFNVMGTFPKAERFRNEKITTMQQPLNLFPPPTISSKQQAWPPFNTSSMARPTVKKTETSPAKTNIYNYTMVYKLVKKLMSMKYIIPFGYGSLRPSSFIPNDHPGPGTYDLREKPKKFIIGARDRNTYVPPLKLTPLRDIVKHEVAPWTYDVSTGMKALCERKDCHKGPTWIKEKDFNRTKWSIKDSPDALYYPKDIGALHCGQPIFNERPKPNEIEITPGPADYHIHPKFTEACLRAHMTQNATSDLQYVKYFTPTLVKKKSAQYF